MRSLKPVLTRLALVAALAVVAVVATGCLPESIEVGLLPMTKQMVSPGPNRGGFDVHEGRAAWVEAGSSQDGPVKFIDEYDVVSTIATTAVSSKVDIGGDWSNEVTQTLVAFQASTPGVHVVDPVTGIEKRCVNPAGFFGGTDWAFGGKWVLTLAYDGSAWDLTATDITNGSTHELDSNQPPAAENIDVNESWASWTRGDAIYAEELSGSSLSVTTAARGAGIVERVSCSGGSLSWTEVESGYRKIWYLPWGSTEATEIATGGPSKEMGGFDGDYVTWFESYGTGSVRARAVAVRYTVVNSPGDQLTYTEFDPSRFAWDFDTLLWQQRTTNKLFLTRFRPIPPRIKGSNRFETLANMAKLRASIYDTGEVEQALGALKAGEEPVAASVDADSAAPVGIADVVVVAGYDGGSPDAIVAPGLCGVYGAPLLIVDYKSVPAVTAQAIAYLRDANRGGINIHVVGGTLAVSKACYKQLSALKGTGTIDRVGGRDRYATAALVASRMKAVLTSRGDRMPGEAMILNGSYRSKWIDAASTGAISASQHIPVLFVRRNSIPHDTRTALTKLHLWRRYIIGGTGNVSDRVRHSLRVAKADRIYGRDTYKTSMAVLRWGQAKGWLATNSIVIAGHLHEALAAGAFGVTIGRSIQDKGPSVSPLVGAPVALTAPKYLPAGLDAYIASMKGRGLGFLPLLIGGEYSVGSGVARRLLEILPDWYWGI
ncbi:MAG: cell wall-binding repeat-containing protein [Coriobacteriia bacterium]|nr:cell wall-binding repeat-containing protein [Coriobacteriia bacterium]